MAFLNKGVWQGASGKTGRILSNGGTFLFTKPSITGYFTFQGRSRLPRDRPFCFTDFSVLGVENGDKVEYMGIRWILAWTLNAVSK